jgi:hypothetical protein
MASALTSIQESTLGSGCGLVRSLRMSVSTSQFMLRAVHLAPARGKVQGMRALHVDPEPIAAFLDLAQGQDLGFRVVLDYEMVPRLQVTTLADGLRNHDLAAA